MTRIAILLCFCFSGILRAQNPLPPIGQWRDHLPYHSVIDIAAFEPFILAATPYSFYSLDTDQQELQRYSRVNGLSFTGVQLLSALTNSRRWLIAYENNQIDLVAESGIRTVFDIVNSNQIPANGILSVFDDGNRVYLCSKIGILLLDTERAEIRETWRIGPNGNETAVYGLARLGDSLYAATEDGLLAAAANDPNLGDFTHWVETGRHSGLPAGACQSVFVFNQQLLTQQLGSFLIRANNSWQSFYQTTQAINNVAVFNNTLCLCLQIGEQSVLRRINSSGMALTELQPPGNRHKIKKAIEQQGQIWMADSLQGLWRYDGNNYELISPSSPAAPALGKMHSFRNKIVAAGASGTQPDYWYEFGNNEWKSYSTEQHPLTANLSNIVDVVLSKSGETTWLAADGGGLIRWQNEQPRQLYQQNLLDPGWRITALLPDGGEGVWGSQPASGFPLVRNDASNNIYRFQPPFSVTITEIHGMAADNRGWIWLAAGDAGVLVYDPGSDRNNSGDDRWRQIDFSTGNLPGNQVYSVGADRQGLIWVGTNDGIAILECADALFNNTGCAAVRPVVQTGSFAGYLLANESVLCVEVDGANRKWVGTTQGAWMISAAGDTVLQHFTIQNSPLAHNTVHAIAISENTGEIFFSGPKGILSWRGTATEPATVAGQIEVFPNPVPPGYNGQIGIRGLVENSIIKITELNGRLVYQGRANGGQAVWNGKDLQGRTVSSGVYLILSTTGKRKETTVGKIVFIHK